MNPDIFYSWEVPPHNKSSSRTFATVAAPGSLSLQPRLIFLVVLQPSYAPYFKMGVAPSSPSGYTLAHTVSWLSLFQRFLHQ
jgi:hypothetical protein